MPWNESGKNSHDNDPWSGKNNQSPPDLDKILSDFIKKIRNAFSFNKGTQNHSSWKMPSSNHPYAISSGIGILLVIWFLSGLFIVNPAEEAVVLRFGQYAEILQPGLHWIARFIDTKYLVDAQKIYSFALLGNFLTKSSDQNDLPNQYIMISSQKDHTNDQSKNLVNVELNVQYRISDPRAYLFNVVNPDETVQQVASGALSDVIGKMKLDDALTTGRELLSANVLERTRHVLQNYNAGIEVLTVTLRKVQAPDQVRTAFSDVNRADQDKATYVQQAQAYASKIVPLAQGVAARTLADANAYQQQVVLTAQANVAKYQALLTAHATFPEVTRERMYLEAMQNILTHTTKILVDFNNSNNMLYLPLDKLMKQQDPLSITDNKSPINIPSIARLATDTSNEAANPIGQSNGLEVKNVSN